MLREVVRSYTVPPGTTWYRYSTRGGHGEEQLATYQGTGRMYYVPRMCRGTVLPPKVRAHVSIP